MAKENAKSRAKVQKKSKRPDLFALGGFDIPFLLLVIVILTIGLVMLFSASYTYAYYNRSGDSTYFFKRQLIFAILGVFIMLIISKIKYDYFRIAAVPVLFVSWLLLVAVLILPATKGEFHRWINLGVFSFQPSEVAKFAIILFCAWSMEKNHKHIVGKTVKKTWISEKISKCTGGKINIYDSFVQLCFYGIIIAITAGLVVLENHLSGTLLILGISIVMLFLGEVKNHWFVVILVIVGLAIVFFALNPDLLKEYAGERITAWLDKSYEPKNARWQTNNSIYAIGSGGLFGTGLGNSKQKHLYVSEPQNDFIFSIVCEELGFIRAAGIIVLFALLVVRGVKIGTRAKDRFGALLSMGIIFQVGLQVALNIAVVTDFLPNTGISLPFFSYGGSSLIMLLAEMGIVLSVSRYSRIEKK